jgi:hypothetical protein
LSQKHTIQKFSLELQMQSSKESHAVQRKSVQLVNEKLLPSLDEYFTKHFDTDQVIRIQRLEIDLGSIASADWEKEFVNNCLSGIKLKMNALKKEQQLSAEEGTEILNQEQASIEQLLVFLATGKMHWSNKGIDFNEWQTMILDAIQKSPTEFKNKLCELMKQHTHAVERLIAQFDDDFLRTIVSVCNANTEQPFTQLIKLLKGEADKAIREKILLTLLLIVLDAASTTKQKELMEWLDIEREKNEHNELFIQLRDVTIRLVEKSGLNEIQSNEQEPLKLKKVETEVYTFINNAGIVLLHPFLQNFLAANNLLQDKNFVDEQAQQRAVHLLQYLATGQLQMPEYEMQLNKVLCGMKDEQHINRFIELTTDEKREADELLQAVIGHWTALKNSSVAGLQETFLQRNAKLSYVQTDDFWKLQVERKGLDILLDKIPWGFGHVQLPWMEKALVVEW